MSLLEITLFGTLLWLDNNQLSTLPESITQLQNLTALWLSNNQLSTLPSKDEQSYDQRSLDSIGRRLWEDLIPEELKTRYWHFRQEVNSLLITSDEPWIPWEMVKPHRYDQDGKSQEDPFWCQKFALARWLPGPSLIEELPAGDVYPVFDETSNLAFVPEEMDCIQGINTHHIGMQVKPSLGNQLEVMDTIRQESFAVMHFACHGTVDARDINNSEIELANGSIRPQDIQAKFSGRRPRPLIFLNACNGARADFGFTGLGGWAERFVQSAHVGAFIGALWKVDDRLAQLFMKTFYTQLLQEEAPIAQAFRTAREAVRKEQPWNSTWLAYVLYAHPLATIEKKPAEEPEE